MVDYKNCALNASSVSSASNRSGAPSSSSVYSASSALSTSSVARFFRSKIACVALACILLFGTCITLWGCSSSSTYEGRWICCAVKNGSTRYDLENLEIDGASLMTLELKGDGTVSMTAMDEDKDMSGLTWEETTTGITLVTDVGSTEASYDSETGELTMDYLGQAVILKKQ